MYQGWPSLPFYASRKALWTQAIEVALKMISTIPLANITKS